MLKTQAKGILALSTAMYIVVALLVVTGLTVGGMYWWSNQTVVVCDGEGCGKTPEKVTPVDLNNDGVVTPEEVEVQVATQQPKSENSPFGVFAAYSSKEFSAFLKQNNFSTTDYWDWADKHMGDIGAHWTRSNLQLAWDFVEPVLGGGYKWDGNTGTDSLVKRMYASENEVHWLGVFHEGGGDATYSPTGKASMRNPLKYPTEYSAFVQAAVERYDGDGISDASSDVRVKYWQAGNETLGWNGSKRTVSEYVDYVRLLRTAIKSADSEAKLVLMSPLTGAKTDSQIVEIITALAPGKEFDAIDLHHWGTATNWKMGGVKEYRKLLDSLGLEHVEIWSNENGTWVGKPRSSSVPQTETDQAGSLVKRYVYNLANGLDRLMWNTMAEWQNYNGMTDSVFNSMGLVADGVGAGEDVTMNNVPRLSYYSYKLLTTKLDHTQWDNIQIIKEADNLYTYRYPQTTGDNVWIIWWEDYNSSADSYTYRLATPGVTEVVVTRAISKYLSGKNVTDFGSAFEYMKVPVVDGFVTLTIKPGHGPLYIEDAKRATLIGIKVTTIAPATDYNRADQLTLVADQAVGDTMGANPQPRPQNTTTPTTNTNGQVSPKCGNNVCDPLEKLNAKLCPQDCD